METEWAMRLQVWVVGVTRGLVLVGGGSYPLPTGGLGWLSRWRKKPFRGVFVGRSQDPILSGSLEDPLPPEGVFQAPSLPIGMPTLMSSRSHWKNQTTNTWNSDSSMYDWAQPWRRRQRLTVDVQKPHRGEPGEEFQACPGDVSVFVSGQASSQPCDSFWLCSCGFQAVQFPDHQHPNSGHNHDSNDRQRHWRGLWELHLRGFQSTGRSEREPFPL